MHAWNIFFYTYTKKIMRVLYRCVEDVLCKQVHNFLRKGKGVSLVSSSTPDSLSASNAHQASPSGVSNTPTSRLDHRTGKTSIQFMIYFEKKRESLLFSLSLSLLMNISPSIFVLFPIALSSLILYLLIIRSVDPQHHFLSSGGVCL